MQFTILPRHSVPIVVGYRAETCPVANSLRSATGETVRAGYGTIQIGECVYATPPDVREWMMMFDFGQAVAYGVTFDTDSWPIAKDFEIVALTGMDVYSA